MAACVDAFSLCVHVCGCMTLGWAQVSEIGNLSSIFQKVTHHIKARSQENISKQNEHALQFMKHLCNQINTVKIHQYLDRGTPCVFKFQQLWGHFLPQRPLTALASCSFPCHTVFFAVLKYLKEAHSSGSFIDHFFCVAQTSAGNVVTPTLSSLWSLFSCHLLCWSCLNPGKI